MNQTLSLGQAGDHFSTVHEPEVGTLADELGALILERSAPGLSRKPEV